MEITSKELFCNIKDIPDEDSNEYDAFFDAEWDKIEYGVKIYGEPISGWLYWHLAHWKIELNTIDERSGENKKYFTNPTLRDNEWMIANHLEQAEKEKKGLMIFGSRRFGKSEFAASYISRSATIYKGTENVISGGNSPDIAIITSKCDKGLSALHPEFQFPRIGDNWSKEVSFGYKEKQGKRKEYSKILIRNFKDGQDTEAAAGTTPKAFIMDEVGKYPFFQCFEAAKPGFDTENGWLCSPVLTGTGGTFKYGESAREIFTNPEIYNFLAIEIPEEGRKTGLYIPGKWSLKVKKEETNLYDYLGDPLKDIRLKEIDFKATPDNGQQLLEEKVYEPALKSKDATAYPKARMYYPTTVDDCFMTDSGNDFPILEAKEHLRFLEANNINGQYVWLKRNIQTNKVEHKFAAKGEVPISTFPTERNENKNAPFVIWEFPISNPPYNLYVSGADPYNQNSSEFSTSLGTVYIYKRMTDVTGEHYQDRIVASYAARPNTMSEWHTNVELLLDYYDAICFPENEAGTFIQYFENKNKLHMLADGLDWLKEHNPTSSTRSRIKGASATPKNIGYMMATMIQYTKEEIQVGTDDEGNPIKKLGVIRIPDKLLLKEIINYREGGNFDRIVAFRHALAYSKHLDKYTPIIALSPVKEEKQQARIPNSPFSVNSTLNPFGSTGSPFVGRFKPSL